ncbi:hypothetical protein BpHYR1_001698 [Brachionus plicatilis]|uniref:Uncharacterized protein n=1 Tax=Brachionus plicatilis TaxID=10195 RepID=A0A3M7SZU0_BRAPC|nr:hypothetical protein BpHYR1_001698 [Brachionus plicatilis]
MNKKHKSQNLWVQHGTVSPRGFNENNLFLFKNKSLIFRHLNFHKNKSKKLNNINLYFKITNTYMINFCVFADQEPLGINFLLAFTKK